ncbi:Uncharacterised protein [uncultured Clostridium sp.]|nr:Uncharacterised protein [uncultured Clostridium sp.]
MLRYGFRLFLCGISFASGKQPVFNGISFTSDEQPVFGGLCLVSEKWPEIVAESD